MSPSIGFRAIAAPSAKRESAGEVQDDGGSESEKDRESETRSLFEVEGKARSSVHIGQLDKYMYVLKATMHTV